MLSINGNHKRQPEQVPMQKKKNKTEEVYILIDDVRSFGNVIIRNYDNAVMFLTWFYEYGYPPHILGLDHDLGIGKTGYDLLKYLLDHKYYAPNIQLITMNPAGRKNMAALLFKAGYNSIDNINFSKG